jgi:hypothetical protein
VAQLPRVLWYTQLTASFFFLKKKKKREEEQNNFRFFISFFFFFFSGLPKTSSRPVLSSPSFPMKSNPKNPQKILRQPHYQEITNKTPNK